jgi:hypothetical protein
VELHICHVCAGMNEDAIEADRWLLQGHVLVHEGVKDVEAFRDVVMALPVCLVLGLVENSTLREVVQSMIEGMKKLVGSEDT